MKEDVDKRPQTKEIRIFIFHVPGLMIVYRLKVEGFGGDRYSDDQTVLPGSDTSRCSVHS